MVVTLNKETADLIRTGKEHLHYGFNEVNARLYKADVRALNTDPRGIEDPKNICEEDIARLSTEERTFGCFVSDEIDDLTAGLEGVGVGSDTDTDVTVVEKRSKQDVCDNLADQPPPQ